MKNIFKIDNQFIDYSNIYNLFIFIIYIISSYLIYYFNKNIHFIKLLILLSICGTFFNLILNLINYQLNSKKLLIHIFIFFMIYLIHTKYLYNVDIFKKVFSLPTIILILLSAINSYIFYCISSPLIYSYFDFDEEIDLIFLFLIISTFLVTDNMLNNIVKF